MQASKKPRALILGSGIAGLSAALKFAESGRWEVELVCKDRLDEGATRYAQGGIASVWSKTDSFQSHIEDTLRAGAGLCNTAVVDLCVHEGPERVRELVQYGVPFTRAGSADAAQDFDLHREGGHTERRILHADDLTGLAIERTLIERIRAHPEIHVHEHHVAIDLITEGKVFKRWRAPGRCLGAYVLDVHADEVRTFSADVTVLATGGAGKVYLYTSNPDVATGDGIAMAHRSGAKIANLEFMQFHPTCLYHPGAKNFLISEALRGEGAVLRNLAGEEFMLKHHAMGSLAPRDIVARAIDIEMKKSGDRHVWLDARHLSGEEWERKFPNILAKCREFGIDPVRESIPVVPAAHYMCGGVLVNEMGRSTLEGLYAIGEVACTGLHGANRLASNSLLEGAVFAHRAFLDADHVTHAPREFVPPSVLPRWESGMAVELEQRLDIAAIWLEIRTLMWNYVGIVRSEERLRRASRRLEVLKSEVNTIYWNYLLTRDLIELRNLVTVADLIVECAGQRKESRGLHATVDYPETNDRFYGRDTVL
jgi:L-aspartate oxidase